MNLAWHFVRLIDGNPQLRDGRPLPARGEWLEEAPPLSICSRGLHASWRALDALSFVAVALRDDVESMITRWVKARSESWPSPEQQWGPRDLTNNLVEGLRGSWTFQRRTGT